MRKDSECENYNFLHDIIKGLLFSFFFIHAGCYSALSQEMCCAGGK